MTFDFIDVGCSGGGSINFASHAFGGTGVGLDIDPVKVSRARERGYDAEVGDARHIPGHLGTFRYGFMSHVLEHLPNRDYAETVVQGVWQRVDAFIAISGPSFDNEDVLRERGFKRYFADWSGHTWHHSAMDIETILGGLGAEAYAVGLVDRIFDSYHRAIVSVDEERNMGPFEPQTHAHKDFALFDTPKLFSSLIAVAVKRDTDLNDVMLRLSGIRVRSSLRRASNPSAPNHRA